MPWWGFYRGPKSALSKNATKHERAQAAVEAKRAKQARRR